MSAAAPFPAPADAHVPVMLDAVVDTIVPRDGATYIDGTFGRGGYSRALLDAAACTVWGIDRDPAAVGAGAEMARRYDGRLTVVEGRFGDMESLLPVRAVDGITLDLGVSSPQIDDAARGFSFQADGPLDMRMGRDGPTAADLVNALPEGELADLIYRLGEDRHARRIARAIVAARADAPITRTRQLAEIVARAVPRPRDGIHPATRTFQALRIRVNEELADLERGLAAAERMLAPGGRLAVVAFHSLEDRIVKDFLRRRAGETGGGSRHRPVPEGPAHEPTFRLCGRRAVRPSDAEVAANPRARSARLRAAERSAAAPWPAEVAS